MFDVEERLRQKLKDLTETQRIAKIGTWRINLVTNQATWSDEMLVIFGLDPSMPPPNMQEQRQLFTPESWDLLQTSLERVKRSGQSYMEELQGITISGEKIHMLIWGEAERDSEGNICAIWGALQDITERKIAEEELRHSEEKFQLLFHKAPLGYQSLDSEGYFLEVNQKWLDILGYKKDEVVGKWFGDFLCPEYVEGFRKRFQVFKAQGYIHSEFDMLRKDGQRIFIAFEGKIGYGSQGEFKQTHCILQDITKQRAAEKALKDNEERYRCLFDNSGIAIGYYTTDGIIISLNRKALDYLGGQLEDYIGRPMYDLFPPQESKMFFDLIANAQSSDSAQSQEICITFSTGPVWFSMTSTKVKNADGEIIGIQIASLDITERKKTEEALFESQIILQKAFENSQAGILIADAPDGKIRYANKAALRMITGSDEYLTGLVDIHQYANVCPLYHSDGTMYTTEEMPIVRAVLRGEIVNEEFVIKRDGRDQYGLATATPIFDANKHITAGLVIFFDITEERKSEETIRKQNELFESLLKILPVGVFMVDANDGTPVFANEKGKELLGRGIITDANEQNLSEVYHSYKKDTNEEYPNAETPIILGMKGISAHIEDMVIERPDGSRKLLEVFGSPVNDTNGNPWASLVTFIDITERKKAEDELYYLSYHDTLTGFFNRRFFEDAMSKLDHSANLPLSVILCDINGLKLINDSFGHTSGDALLIKAADTIRAACGPDAIISRIGGDEFAVILPKTGDEHAARIIKEIKRLASQESVENIELSIAVGYDTKQSDKQKFVEVLSNAENHMYRHKLYERSSTRNKTIEIIMNTLFAKSDRESMHSDRVSVICLAIASRMDFDKDEINKIKIAGLVHDIGKIGIDEKILNKPGKLTSEERDQINKHPEVGWRILSSSSEFSELANFILDHHERWDGTGYPNGLRGKEIPLEARIIAVADSYDAMTRDRSYRAGLSQEEAVVELERCSGTQFDPDIVNIFVEKVLPNEDIQ